MAEYVFEPHAADAELTRLRLLEEAFDATTQRHLAPAARSSARCLEIGAGAGSVVRWLAERVGEDGRVVALDRTARHLVGLESSWVTIVEGELAVLDSEPFDLIHARYVFIHNRDAAALLERTASLLVPGGRLVLEEPDFLVARWLASSRASAGNRVNAAIAAMFRARGQEPGFGSIASRLCAAAGLRVERVEGELHIARGGSPVARVMGASAEALRGAYVETGQATSHDVDEFVAGADDPDELAVWYATVRVHATRVP